MRISRPNYLRSADARGDNCFRIRGRFWGCEDVLIRKYLIKENRDGVSLEWIKFLERVSNGKRICVLQNLGDWAVKPLRRAISQNVENLSTSNFEYFLMSGSSRPSVREKPTTYARFRKLFVSRTRQNRAASFLSKIE